MKNINTNKKLCKCDFCQYRAGNKCTVTADSWYCQEANDEFQQYLREIKEQQFKNNKAKKRDRFS